MSINFNKEKEFGNNKNDKLDMDEMTMRSQNPSEIFRNPYYESESQMEMLTETFTETQANTNMESNISSKYLLNFSRTKNYRQIPKRNFLNNENKPVTHIHIDDIQEYLKSFILRANFNLDSSEYKFDESTKFSENDEVSSIRSSAQDEKNLAENDDEISNVNIKKLLNVNTVSEDYSLNFLSQDYLISDNMILNMKSKFPKNSFKSNSLYLDNLNNEGEIEYYNNIEFDNDTVVNKILDENF